MISERRQIAERVLSEGNCEAARIRGNRVRDLNKIQAFYEFTRTMQSYRLIIAANTTLILSTDSDLFKFLKEMDSTGDAAGD
jgi:membrane protease subunit HflC